MIRATTVGVLKGYRSNLMKSFVTLNSARNTIFKPRNFHCYADDPAAASQSYNLRRSLQRVGSQLGVSNSVTRKYEAAYSALESVVNNVDNGKSNSAFSTLLVDLNDPTGDARVALGKVLYQLGDDVIQSMNSRYEDAFIFAGADGLNVPFEIKNDQLYYRGVPVDAEVPPVATDANGGLLKVNANGDLDPAGGYYLKTRGTKVISKAEYDQIVADNPNDPTAIPDVLKGAGGTLQLVNKDGAADTAGDYYLLTENASVISESAYQQAQQDVEKLEFMSNEKYFVDIGLGMQEDGEGNLIESSAFDASLQGINFLGYGVDEDGDPKNLVSLIRKMAKLSEEYSQEEWSKDSTAYQDLDRMTKKFEIMAGKLHTMHTDMTAEAKALKNNNELLTDTADTLKEQILELEDMNEAEAISSFIWAQYCYNAALKVGNSILSESLMDYMS